MYTIVHQCADQLAASIDTNQPRRTSSGAGVADATTWATAAWAIAVDTSSETPWLLLVCVVDSGGQSVTNDMEVPFVAGLSVTGSCSTSDSE